MTTVFNRPEAFKDEMVEGLLAAYGRYLDEVPGASAVMRRGGPLAGKVSVVIGGGSGHYPTFAGFVGAGLADGAVIGDIFTSPSTEHIYRSMLALDGGAGVLLSYGRYSGDIMNFGLAETRARAEGIDVRTVLVTDDIASAPPERSDERRGIAGDFCVFKVAGAAAERGDDMDEVERLARKANARTRTLGVAFGGCTLPGSPEPLFSVDPGRMEIGLGIHGEPGVRSGKRVPGDELAQLLVEPLLAGTERPPGAGGRAAVLVNGLGRTKYEELFVLYREVARLLHAGGVSVVAPEVGELVTSLDMAGCSLTVFWLDEELEELWTAPADSPGYRKPGVALACPYQARRFCSGGHTNGDGRPRGEKRGRRGCRLVCCRGRAQRADIHAGGHRVGRRGAWPYRCRCWGRRSWPRHGAGPTGGRGGGSQSWRCSWSGARGRRGGMGRVCWRRLRGALGSHAPVVRSLPRRKWHRG